MAALVEVAGFKLNPEARTPRGSLDVIILVAQESVEFCRIHPLDFPLQLPVVVAIVGVEPLPTARPTIFAHELGEVPSQPVSPLCHGPILADEGRPDDPAVSLTPFTSDTRFMGPGGELPPQSLGDYDPVYRHASA